MSDEGQPHAIEWSEAHQLAIEQENELRAGRSERAAEVKSLGFDRGALTRWYDALPLAEKIKIQKKNIEVASLLRLGATSVEHFQDKLIALMEEQNGESRTNENAVLPAIKNGPGLGGAAISGGLSG